MIDGEEKIIKYISFLPTDINNNTVLAIGLMLLGFFLVYLLENFSKER